MIFNVILSEGGENREEGRLDLNQISRGSSNKNNWMINDLSVDNVN